MVARVVSLLTVLAAAAAAAAISLPGEGAAKSSASLLDRPLLKAIWGPASVNGESQFPIYKQLGVDLYQTGLRWDQVARRQPAAPTDPKDPAYVWPKSMDYVMSEAARNGVGVMLMVQGSPEWESGERDWFHHPRRAADYAAFVRAAARRYPRVRHWMIWGEPARSFGPLPQGFDNEKRVPKSQAAIVRRYAAVVDAAYGQLKKANRRNVVIGGNTFVGGNIRPREWIRHLRLPDGRPPRMDVWGHNPYSRRVPDLCDVDASEGVVDYSMLGDLARWVDRDIARPRRTNVPIFVSEFGLPNPKGDTFGWFFTPEQAALRLRRAFSIARGFRMIYGLGYYLLRDVPGKEPGARPVNSLGLIGVDGKPKPTFDVYKQAKTSRTAPAKCAPRIPRRG